MVDVGEKAPGFTLVSDDGQHISLADYLGKKVVLYFYPKDMTPGCTQEEKEFRDLAEQYRKENVVILGVSKDSVQSHQKFKEKNNLPFTLLSDVEGKLLEQYGVWKKKSLYGKTFMAIERTTFLIDEEGIVRKIYRKVNPKGHAKTCLLDFANP